MTKSSKVIMLIRNVDPSCYGGAETYQLMLANELKRYGFEPIIVTSSAKLLEESKTRNIRTIKAMYKLKQNWSGWRNVLLPVYCVWQLRLERWYKKIFKEYNPIAVNIQSRDDWIAGTKAASALGIRVLWTDHMDFRSWVLENVGVWYKNMIGKWVIWNAKKAFRIIMISNTERKYFDKVTQSRGLHNVATIRNGVIDVRKQYAHIRPEKNTFCYVGRVEEYKGIGDLIEAFLMLNSRDGVILNIYGDGRDFKKYKKLYGGERRIVFHGQTSEPIKKIAENEVFVLPSYREGLSLSLLDAAMMGKPIIATRVGGNPEVIINGETGWLVKPHSKKELAFAMNDAINNPVKANECGIHCRERYEKEFDFGKTFKEEMLSLYEK